MFLLKPYVIRQIEDTVIPKMEASVLYLAASLMMFWRNMSRVSRVPWICFRRRKIFS